MRLVVLGEEDFCVATEFLADEFLHPDPLPNPQRDRHQERPETPRSASQVAVQDTVELQEWFLVERHQVHVSHSNPAGLQAPFHRVFGEGRVVLLARKPLLLRSRHDATVLHQACGAVVIKRRNPENRLGAAHAQALE